MAWFVGTQAITLPPGLSKTGHTMGDTLTPAEHLAAALEAPPLRAASRVGGARAQCFALARLT